MGRQRQSCTLAHYYLTVEVLPHTRREQTEKLLREVSGMGYSCFLLEEVCGWPVDCRNVLAIPRERAALLFQSANQIPELGGRLFEVTAKSVSNHAFPCCAHGLECCPHHAKAAGRTSTKASTGGCCTGALVSSWLARQEGRGTNGSETAFKALFCNATQNRSGRSDALLGAHVRLEPGGAHKAYRGARALRQ